MFNSRLLFNFRRIDHQVDRNVKGIIKIIRKPRPIGNEIKNLSNAASNMVINLEFCEGKDIIKDKDHAKQFGATAATRIKLTEPYHGASSYL